MPRKSLVTLACSAALIALPALTFTGCESLNTMKPGGRMASFDMQTYISTTYSPKTVRLVDTRTLEEIWSVDVPVDRKLVVKFYKNRSKDNHENPDIMRWEVFDATDMMTLLDNQMPVPSAHARRLEWELRTGPEYAPEEFPDALDIMPGSTIDTTSAGG